MIMYSHASVYTRDVPPASFAAEIAPATLASVFARQPLETHTPGVAVFWESDAASDVFQIASGCLRLCRVLSDGRRALMGFVFAGEVLGISFPASYPYTAEAVTEVRIRRLARGRFQAAVDARADLQSQV